MNAVKHNLMVNICLFLFSLSSTSVLAYYIYNYLRKPQVNIVFREANGDYWFSLYNRQGEKISDIEGSLKLVIDPFTVYQNYPNQISSKYSINRYGFRDTFATHKPYTAIVLGGSAAFGFALDNNDQTFPSKINKYNDKYNIINAAVIGFLSGQELAQMIHYLDDFHPSLYIVFNGWNDVYDPVVFTKNAFRENHRVYQGPVGYNNTFFSIERRLSDHFQITKKNQELQEAKLFPIGSQMSENELLQKIKKKYFTNVDKMHSFANARGSKLLLVFQPELGNKKVKSLSEKEVLEAWGYKYGYLDNKIPELYRDFVSESKKYFQEKQIRYIDINDENEFSENEETLFFDVVHPNELGHDIIAKIIVQRLLENF